MPGLVTAYVYDNPCACLPCDCLLSHVHAVRTFLFSCQAGPTWPGRAAACFGQRSLPLRECAGRLAGDMVARV